MKRWIKREEEKLNYNRTIKVKMLKKGKGEETRGEEKRKKGREDAGWPLVRGPEFDRCFQ